MQQAAHIVLAGSEHAAQVSVRLRVVRALWESVSRGRINDGMKSFS